VTKTEPSRKTDSFPSTDSANEKPWTLGLLKPYQFPFPFYHFFFLINFIGVLLIYNVVLVSAVQQSESVMHIH